ncbi:hypothetical protein DSS3P8_229 [Roseobacter phage DSS3P8]|nr:hypothetical protein DSS3P8_229 [Roseobacter phage DSS3P8]
MIVQFKKAPAPSIDEILEALDLPAPDYGPDSIHLAPGETIRDRYAHHVAKGRAKEAARRRAAFKLI